MALNDVPREFSTVTARTAAAGVAQVAATMAEIARVLESPHDAEARIRRALSLVNTLVPCDRCALYRRSPDGSGRLALVPDLSPIERTTMAEFLEDVLRYLEGDGARRALFDSRVHLALPVIGLDTILGVLLVDREHEEHYEPHHLRLLSAVASQLGAYLTFERLHRQSVDQARLLVEREQQLRGAARFREEFIGVVGHDLRNPLSAIRAGADLLTARAPLEAADRQVVGRIAGSAARMARMIDDLMDFARGRLAGAITLRRSRVDLHALCRDAAAEAHVAHGRTVTLSLAGDPAGMWDGDRLAQLLSNLVVNAVQHSPADSAVSLQAYGDEQWVVVEVNNAGPAIPPEQLAHLFEPFRRGTNAMSRGLGLGLYIAERIVTAHAGTITVTSTDGDGTTFVVRLPRHFSVSG